MTISPGGRPAGSRDSLRRRVVRLRPSRRYTGLAHFHARQGEQMFGRCCGQVGKSGQRQVPPYSMSGAVAAFLGAVGWHFCPNVLAKSGVRRARTVGIALEPAAVRPHPHTEPTVSSRVVSAKHGGASRPHTLRCRRSARSNHRSCHRCCGRHPPTHIRMLVTRPRQFAKRPRNRARPPADGKSPIPGETGATVSLSVTLTAALRSPSTLHSSRREWCLMECAGCRRAGRFDTRSSPEFLAC